MKLLLIIFLLFIINSGITQNVVIQKDFVTNYKKVVFQNHDSLIEGYIFMQSDGHFGFQRIPFDTSEFVNRMIIYKVDKNNNLIAYKNVFVEIHDNKDTITNYFPNIDLASDYEKSTNLQVQFQASYILRNIKEKQLMNETSNIAARLICFYKNLHDDQQMVEVTNIYLNDSDIEVNSKSIYLKNQPLECIILHDTNYFIKKTYNKKLLKRILENMDTIYTCTTGADWIIEYNKYGQYHYMVASESCLIDRMKDRKRVSRKERGIAVDVHILFGLLTPYKLGNLEYP